MTELGHIGPTDPHETSAVKTHHGALWEWAMMTFLAAAIVIPIKGKAAEFPFRPGMKELGPRVGYGVAKDEDVQMVPLSLSLGYILYSGKYSVLPSGALELAVEPFISPIASSKGGSVEAGLALPVFRYHFDVGRSFVPYVEGGVGALYTDLRGFNLGGKFQFLSLGGLGLSYFLDENRALHFGWRFRHVSNLGIHDDNAGLNSFIVQVGFSFFLPPR